MNRSLKRGMLLVSYGILLYVLLTHFNIVITAFQKLMGILKPVIIGVVLAYVINLLMRPMETKWLAALWKKVPALGRRRRGICIVLSILAVLALIVALCFFIIPQIGESLMLLASSVPGYIDTVEDFLFDVEGNLDMQNPVVKYVWDTLEGVLEKYDTMLTSVLTSVATWLINFVTDLIGGVVNAFLGLIFAVYILADKEHLASISRRILYALFKDSVRLRILDIFSKINRAFGGFITGQLTEAVILGSLCFVGLTVIGFFVDGMPYALLISVLVAVLSIIPILGAYLSAIPSAFLILIIDPMKAVIFVVFLVVLQQFEGNVIYPRVVGNSIGIGGMWVLLALTVGGGIMGIPGMVIGIPAFAVVYALIREEVAERIQKKEAAAAEVLAREARKNSKQN